MTIPILGGNKKQPQQKTVKLDPSTLSTITCPDCGSVYFDTVQTIKVISELQTQSGQKEFVPIPILRCVICSRIIEKPGDYIKEPRKADEPELKEDNLEK